MKKARLIAFLICIFIFYFVISGNAPYMENIPRSVQDFYSRLVETAANHAAYFRIKEPFWDFDYPGMTGTSCYIQCYDDTSQDTDAVITFARNNDDEMYQTFFVHLFKEDKKLYQKIITMIVASMPTDIAYDTAQAKAELLLSSLSADDFSETVEIGEYRLTMAYNVPDTCVFAAVYQSEMKMLTTNRTYTSYPYEEIKQNAHDFQKIVLQGTVVDHTVKRTPSTELFDCVHIISDGHPYNAYVSRLIVPVPLEVGKTYTFYGTIVDRSEGEDPNLRIIRIDTR